MVEDVWCMAMLIWCQDFCFLNLVPSMAWSYDMRMILHDGNMFSHLKYKGQNIVIEIKILKCMNVWWKTCYALLFFWSFFFRVNCSLCNNQTHCFFYAFEIEECHKLQSLMFKMIIHMTFSLATSCMLAWIHRQVKNGGHLEGFWGNWDNNVDTSFITRSFKGDVICEFRMKNTRDPKIAPIVVYRKKGYEDMDQWKLWRDAYAKPAKLPQFWCRQKILIEQWVLFQKTGIYEHWGEKFM